MNIWYNKAQMEKQTYYYYLVYDICSVSLNVMKKCSYSYRLQIMIEFWGKIIFCWCKMSQRGNTLLGKGLVFVRWNGMVNSCETRYIRGKFSKSTHIARWNNRGLHSLSRGLHYRKIFWKSGSHEIQVYIFPIAIKFYRHLGSVAVEMPFKFQSDTIIATYNLAMSRFHEIWRQDVLPLSE